MTDAFTYELIPSDFGEIGLVRTMGGGDADASVVRILLPAEGIEMRKRIEARYPLAVEQRKAAAGRTGRQIRQFVKGEAVDFSLADLDLKHCGMFQQQVLRLEFQIPRGKVSAYGDLAARLGHPRAARAVGTALARNPFPIVIPCHRAVRADGTLGGFGGGLRMKKRFLEMEGVGFDRSGRVKSEYFW